MQSITIKARQLTLMNGGVLRWLFPQKKPASWFKVM
jgi:hypothetical protein